MIGQEIDSELDFIKVRVHWLEEQPRDSEGILLHPDLRAEAGVISRRIDEIVEELS